MKEEWLMSGAVVPVDAETTAALVAEIHRLIDVVGGMVLAQPVQEPVITVRAWRDENGDQTAEFQGLHKLPDGEYTLYTTPQPRPWVGLTDEQRRVCVDTPFVADQWANIEAKLKELNHE